MKTLTTVLAAVALTLTVNAADEKKPAAGGAAAPAAPGAPAKPKMDPAVAFGKLDKDSSKSVSKEEFLASPAGKKDPAKAEAAFAKKDKDGNGSLSIEEFSAAGGKKKK
jgi:hypothetical protein